jgi:nicotinamide phosphoribosyltransferase
LVIRPDSGDPVETLSKIFILLGELLQDEITLNSKKHWVLPSYLRVIQGDGINLDMMKKILHRVVNVLGWSATNIAFGSGGGLLQQVNRDTQKFAFKCCAIKRDGKVVEVFKDPITDQGKRSKSGRLDLVKRDGVYETVKIPDSLSRHPDSVLETVFHNGNILFHNTLAECRARMSI